MITYIIGGVVVIIIYIIWGVLKDVSKLIEDEHQREKDMEAIHE